MPSRDVLKQFRTLKKSDWSWVVCGRKKNQRKTFKKSLFRYLTDDRSEVLLDIHFDAENQDYILRTVEKLRPKTIFI